jgi:hypothetical protein
MRMNPINQPKKITLFPGGFQSVRNYGYPGVDIWTGENFGEVLKDSDFFIGHSAGASFALRHAANQTSKFIFVNPLMKKMNMISLVLRWIMYAFQEGLPMKKFVPIRYWPGAFGKVMNLAKIDFLSAIKNIPKENITVIRGKKDYFFCDEEAAKIVRENGIRLIEVDAGHDWNENIAEAVREMFLR